MREARVTTETALRLSGASVLLGNAALVAGIVVSTVHGLGPEPLPLTSAEGLQKLGESAGAYRLREALWLAYPVLLLPQAIALYALLRDRAPALLWPLVFWCVGLTLAIAVDLVTATVAPELGVAYLRAAPDARPVLQALASSLAHAVLVAQLLCDTLSGTLVYPFFAAVAYRAGFVSRGLALTAVVSSLLVFVLYRGVNLLLPDAAGPSTVFGLGFYGVIWWDVTVALKLLRVRRPSAVLQPRPE
jgi:hypothetical protein